MVGVVQNKLNLIEYDTKTGAMCRLNFSAQVAKQGFNFSPVNICIDWVMKYCPKQA